MNLMLCSLTLRLSGSWIISPWPIDPWTAMRHFSPYIINIVANVVFEVW